MARDLTVDTEAALTADTAAVVFLFYANFPSGAVRCWTGTGNLSWDGETWVGTGDLGWFDTIKESGDLAANGAVFTLTGVPTDLVAAALDDAYRGKDCALYIGALDLATEALEADPYVIFDGTLDVMGLELGGDSAAITITAESRLVDFNRPAVRRYTHEDQQIDFPGDLGLEFVAGLQGKTIHFGVVPAAPATTGAGGAGAGNPSTGRNN